MDITIRQATLEDFDAIIRMDAVSFGEQYEPEDVDAALSLVDPTRFLVATESERIVGVTGDYPFAMTVPGGGCVDVPGVTWVSVTPTHRRRGILTELMRRQLRGFVDAAAPAAILTASESGIYGRYGYGPATHTRKFRIDRRRSRLIHPGEATSVMVATPEQARELMPAIHDRWRVQVPGALNRTSAWWDVFISDLPSRRHGLTKMFYLLHADGYVAYRVQEQWGDWDPQNLCVIADYAIVTPEAHAALWEVLLGLDLFATVETDRMPFDDPLPFRVTEPRQVRTTSLIDGMWVRPLDVPTLLSARRYAVEVDVVMEVTDDLLGDARYHLQGGPDGASCVRTERSAQLGCGVAQLGTLYLGGQRLATMARAGAIQVDDDRLATRLDRALLADRAPIHGTPF